MSDTKPQEFQTPRWRYWGDQKPPTNRADVFSVTAAADDQDSGTASSVGSTATLRMYGPIDSWGWIWGISAQEVSEALDALPDGITDIRLRINSPGGEVWEALAILNMLRAHPARVTAVVDGLAASAASIIATGVDETVMSPGTQMMIHDGSSFAIGNAAAMERCRKMLDSVSNSIAAVYAESAGGTSEQWRQAMIEETWYTADEAVASGLADRVGVVVDAGETTTAGEDSTELDEQDDDEPIDRVNSAAARFDLSLFAHAGRDQAPAPRIPDAAVAAHATHTPPAEPPADPTNPNRKESDMSDTLKNGLRDRLGLKADAELSDEQLLAAVDEVLTEHAEPTAQLPEGVVAIDQATLDQLQASAAEGREARRLQQADDRERVVTDALRTGRITAHAAERWRTSIEADDEAGRTSSRDLLASLAPGAVPVEAKGYTGGVDEANDDDNFYDKVAGATGGQKES